MPVLRGGDPDEREAELGQSLGECSGMLAETVTEPVDQETEGVDRQSRLVELRWLLGEVQGCKLEQPIAVVRDHILRRGSSKMLCHFQQLLLGSQLLLAHGARPALPSAAFLAHLSRRSRPALPSRPSRARGILPCRIRLHPAEARDVPLLVSTGCSCC